MESSVNDRSLLRVDRVGTQGWRGGSGVEQVGCEGMRLCVLARPLSPASRPHYLFMWPAVWSLTFLAG